jgi:hypothetical protein
VVRARHDVREELVGAPNSSEVLGEFGALEFDEFDALRSVARAECTDVGKRQPGPLADLNHPGLADRLLVVGAVARAQPARA